MVTGARPI